MVDFDSVFGGKLASSGSCLLWTGYVGSDGYGSLVKADLARAMGQTNLRQPIRVHVAAWFLVTGVKPRVVHHLCHNKHCIATEHLVDVTPKEHALLHQTLLGDCCLRGHQDWYVKPSGDRVCRACDNERQRAARRDPVKGPRRRQMDRERRRRQRRH